MINKNFLSYFFNMVEDFHWASHTKLSNASLKTVDQGEMYKLLNISKPQFLYL